jgi:hypothetical protein
MFGNAMNHSLFSADRGTHLKMVAVALIAAMAVVVVGITARTGIDEAAGIQPNGPVLKAGKLRTYTDRNSQLVPN